MPHFNSDGVSLHYEVYGVGRPVILIHGFSRSFADNWVAPGWLDLLTASGFQVVGLDVRGHGQSEKLYRPEQYTTPILARDVLNLLDHLAIAQADLLGFSMGGGVALYLGMYHAGRFGKIAVGGAGDAGIYRNHDPAQVARVAEALESTHPESIADPIAWQLRTYAERVGGNDLGALAALMRTGGWPGGIKEVLPISRPLLFVVAENDQFMTRSDELAALFPHARRVVIPDRNHNTVVGDPRFKEVVLAFLLS
jgi:pimeloyl-ACP methyl ester carboxylesterase